MSDATTLTRPAEGMKLAISSAKDAHYKLKLGNTRWKSPLSRGKCC